MQKKTYMKPLVCLYAIEASTILAGSTDTPVKPSSGLQVGNNKIESGDGDDAWE